jgi:hypothetical protein
MKAISQLGWRFGELASQPGNVFPEFPVTMRDVEALHGFDSTVINSYNEHPSRVAFSRS